MQAFIKSLHVYRDWLLPASLLTRFFVGAAIQHLGRGADVTVSAVSGLTSARGVAPESYRRGSRGADDWPIRKRRTPKRARRAVQSLISVPERSGGLLGSRTSFVYGTFNFVCNFVRGSVHIRGDIVAQFLTGLFCQFGCLGASFLGHFADFLSGAL